MESATLAQERRGRLNKTVAQVMHTGTISCRLDTPIPEVARLMTQNGISAVPVVDDAGYLAGIITRTDLVTLRAYDDYWRAMKAENVMVRDLATTTPDQSVAAASKQMTDRRIHRLLVIERDAQDHARPIGVLSQSDIVRDMSLEE